MTDADGRFTFVSDQAEQILGWETHELDRALVRRPRPGRRPARRDRALPLAPAPPARAHRSRLTSGPATGATCDGGHGHRDGGRRPVPRGPRCRPRRVRPREAGARPAPPGGRARLVRGAGPPRPRTPRLGDPGAVLDDPAVALHRAAARSRTPRRCPGSWPRCASSSAGARRDAGPDLRAAPGQRRGERPDRALRTHSAALSGRIGLPVVVEADSPTARRSTSRRRSTGSPRRRSTTSSSTRARARSGSSWTASPDGVRLRVSTTAAASTRPRSPTATSGLAGMRSRAERLGGVITVTTVRGGGTTIEVVVPPRWCPNASPTCARTSSSHAASHRLRRTSDAWLCYLPEEHPLLTSLTSRGGLVDHR